MTSLSVNVNKIALLRNSRGRDFPKLVNFVERLVNLGVKGITVHPRPDERHITRQDVTDISVFLKLYSDVEFNIEGYPSEEFMALVSQASPAQCTLVPDDPRQLTSDHGWDVAGNKKLLKDRVQRLKDIGVRSSLFFDPVPERVAEVVSVGADRIELYTEEYASHFGLESDQRIFDKYEATAAMATSVGIGVNAGHDLDLHNLRRFLDIPDILEVSIGHALVVECLLQGLEPVIEQYLAITAGQESESHYY